MTRSVCLVSVVMLSILVRGQYVPPSPCPDIFSYENDGQQVYGMIRYQPRGQAKTVTIRANFSIKAALPTSYVGRLDVIGEKQYVLQSVLRGQPLNYRVHFPLTSPVPKLTAITVNGNVQCVGQPEFAGPGEAVTSLSLNHVLFAEGEAPGPGAPSFNLDNPLPGPGRPGFGTNDRNPSLVLDNGNRFEIDPNRFFDGDSNEPSYMINTITIPNRNQGGQGNQFTNQFTNQFFTENTPTQSNTQFEESPTVVPTVPQQRPTIPQQRPTIQQQRPTIPQQAPTIPQQRPTIPQQTSTIPQLTPATVPQPQPVATECGVVSGGNEQVALVYHGTSVSRGDWPWLTAIYVKRGSGVHYICAGSLVSNQHVVTAAHCMHERTAVTAMSQFLVKTGAFNLDSWSDAVIRGLRGATIHSNYNPQTLENDILLLTLDSPVPFNNVLHPVCLWEGSIDSSYIVGQYGTVVGWGLNELRGSGQGEPRMASIPIVSTTTCRASRIEFHKLTSGNTICAGDRNGTGPCNGDSGGGLYMLFGGRWRLRGVVSVSLRPVTGEAKCNLDEYVVFTDVAQYLPWLRQHMAG